MALKDVVERNPPPIGVDFIGAAELARLTGYSRKRLYHMHATGNGPLGHVLTKLGSRVGVWAADYQALLASWRKLPPTVPEQVSAN